MKRIKKINKFIKKFKHLFNKQENKRGRKRVDYETVLKALLFKTSFGHSFRLLANEYEISKSTIHKYYGRWTNTGIFSEIYKLIKNKGDFESIIMDSTPVNYVNVITNKYNGYKGRKCTKLTIGINHNKDIKLCELRNGNEHDIESLKCKKELILNSNVKNFYADKAYYSKELSSLFKDHNIKFNVVPKKVNKVYKKRVVVEHFFGLLKQYREVERSFYRKIEHLESNLTIAFILLLL